jgi:hypothetical protein
MPRRMVATRKARETNATAQKATTQFVQTSQWPAPLISVACPYTQYAPGDMQTAQGRTFVSGLRARTRRPQ